MEWMTKADVVLLLIAAYVAVMTLIQMMKRRHDEVVNDVKNQLAAHRKRFPKDQQSPEDRPGDQMRDVA